MQAKKIVTIISLVFLTTALISNAHTQPASPVTFQGIGVRVNLTFPGEAHPLDSIYHNLTITAQATISSLNITMYVYALVASDWQLIDTPYNIPWQFPLQANQSLPSAEILFLLPENANGTLRCIVDIQTNTTNYASFTFYTTQVRTQTYNELLTVYESLLASYISLNLTYHELNSNYVSLNSTYSSLKTNYTVLNATYVALLTQNNAFQDNYNALNSAYGTLQDKFNDVQSNMKTLQTDLGIVEKERNNLQTLNSSWQKNYTRLRSDYDNLNQDYRTLNNELNNLNGNYTELQSELANQSTKMISNQTSDQIIIIIFLAAIVGLIALIVYIKRKEPEPYMVIRKETVAIKPDEEKSE